MIQFTEKQVSDLINAYFVISFYNYIKNNESKYKILYPKNKDLSVYEEVIKKVLNVLSKKFLTFHSDFTVNLDKKEEDVIRELLESMSNSSNTTAVFTSGAFRAIIYDIEFLGMIIKPYYEDSIVDLFNFSKLMIKKSELANITADIDNDLIHDEFGMIHYYLNSHMDIVKFNSSSWNVNIDPKIRKAIKSYNSLIEKGIIKLEKEIDKGIISLIRINMGLR
jgi:hypothetical protein